MNHTEIDSALLHFRKSSHSGQQGQCVEVANADVVAVFRDSKNPTAGHIVMPRSVAARIVSEIKADRLNLP